MSIKSKRVFGYLLCVLLIITALYGCSVLSGVTAERSAAAFADVKLIDEESMMQTVQELTSEKYGGRLAGTGGNEAAALYIANRFREIGLKNPEGLENYIQRYPQTVITLKDVPKLSIIGEGNRVLKEFKYVDNFVMRSLSSKSEDIDIAADLYLVKDINEIKPENKELKGKILLIPWKLRLSVALNRLIELVNKSGAAGALGEYETMGGGRKYRTLSVTPMLGPWLKEKHDPFINVDGDAFAELVSAFEKGHKASIQCSFSRENYKKVPNVVGVLPGKDEKLKNEYVIIGAHFDHVGQNLNGSYNPGGLDNASGVAAMLEIARVLKENNAALDKPVLFIAFNGEEGGLLGSEYYAEYPVYPIDNSVMICLDMVGSSEQLPLMITGAEESKLELQEAMYECSKELGIDARKDIGGGSDHVSFAARGINSVLLINDDYNNGYHSPEDMVEDVDKGRIEEVVKLVLHYLDKNAYAKKTGQKKVYASTPRA